MTQIPPALIGTTAPILDTHYTHAELNALFMQAGFPGDPPEGNKTQKCLSWLRRANTECADPLSSFGTLIAEMMDVEPTPWRLEQYAKDGDARERIKTVLEKEQLSYQRGGYIIGAHLKGPSKSLAERLKAGGLAAVDLEYQRAYNSIASDPAPPSRPLVRSLKLFASIILKQKIFRFQTNRPLRRFGPKSPKTLVCHQARWLTMISNKSCLASSASLPAWAHFEPMKGQRMVTVIKPTKSRPRHARLAVHAAHTMALFILETWEARGRKK